MNAHELDKLLRARAQSPTPQLDTDPFLATRVRALVRDVPASLFPEWRISTLIGAAALLIGMFIGSGLEQNTTQITGSQSYTSADDISGALYQEALSDDFSSILSTLDKGEKE